MTNTPQLRIGDADRDSAVEALSEHYASGRLSKDEYDERVEQAWSAKFHSDLDPLFTDLPRGDRPRVASWDSERRAPHRAPTGSGDAWRRPWQQSGQRRFPHILVAALLAVPAIVGAAVALEMPWLLFVLFWVFACGGFGRRHAHTSHRW